MKKELPPETIDGISPNIDRPIARVVSLRLATVITIVTILVGIAGYFYSMMSTEELVREQLLKYIDERGLRESAFFLEAEAYQARFQAEYLERYKRMGDKDPVEWFETHMEYHSKDGTYRAKSELYYGKDRELGRRDDSASVLVGSRTKLTPEVRRAFAIGYDMVTRYGPAWRKPFLNLYFASPEKIAMDYWPGTPWGLIADDEVEWRNEEWFDITTIEKNPERQHSWSGVLYDERDGNWMVSGVTPLDVDGKQVGLVGTDLLLDDLVERTIKKALSGTYNIIMRADGRIITHPDKIEEIITNKGMLLAETSTDEHLRRIYELARTVTTFPDILDNNRDGEFLAVTQIQGPKWYFITVYPKSLLKNRAMRNVGFIFLSGIASLAALFLVIRLILKRNLVYPLGQLTQAVRKFEIPLEQWSDQADGFVEEASKLGTRPDEIGLLVSSFVDMGGHLRATYRDQEIITSILHLAQQSISLEEMLSQSLKLVLQRQGYGLSAKGAVFLVDKDAKELVMKVQHGLPESIKDSCGHLPFGRCLCGLAALERKVVFAGQVDHRHENTCPDIKSHGHYCMPIQSAGKVLGVLNLYVPEGYRRIQEEEQFVAAVADVMAGIIQRKQTEQALRRAQKMDAIGQLTGGIAHDLNNILGIILGNLELLKGNIPGGDKVLKRIDTIQKSAQRTADLTKQLLSFSRRQAAQAVMTDIRRVIRDMDSLIARSVTPEVEVEHNFTEELWLTEIDPGDFQDALLNLVINARDAMPGGGRLILETSNKTLDDAYCTQNPGVIAGEYVQLAVSDSGKGLPPEQQEQIFEPFFSTKEPGKGTGLGLAMVYGFVKRSGGHIKAYSEQGIGTTFRIYLPRTHGEERPLETINEHPETLPHGIETLLVIDDEDGLLELAQTSLEALGYRVLTATGGRQALERLAEEPTVDLLFSDVVMPGGMNGYELAERATADRPELKVLLTSGYTDKAVARSGQARFAAHLLSKPYTQGELAQRVRVLLGDKGQRETESNDLAVGGKQPPEQPTTTPQALEHAGPAPGAMSPVIDRSSIYLIDDEPELLELLSDTVKQAGLSVQGFTRASRFFEQVKVFETNSILVLDLQMPEMDGIQVMRRLAKMTDPPVLILISGWDPGVLLAAEKLGRAYNLEILTSLAKPVPLDELRQLLDRYALGDGRKRQDDALPARRDITPDELRQAIQSGQMVLHHQPQLEIATNTLTGVEALVRWQHPEQGLIYPDRFIHIAEQHGLMRELTHWVIDQAVRQEQQWQSAGIKLPVAVNISADNITSLTLPEQLSELLTDKKLDPRRLTLEVTEGALMGELVTSLDILTRLRLKGIKLSIDDFGTGYSSLLQLHRVPFTELKIDRGFVANMTKDEEARAIVKTCNQLGQELNMRVVAEGVEDQQSWDLLAELGCDRAQGYFIARPMSGSDLLEWVRKREHLK